MMLAQDTFNFSFDTDVVVVGRVSMNKKKAKKNLQKIACKVNTVEPKKAVTEVKVVEKTIEKPVAVAKIEKPAVKKVVVKTETKKITKPAVTQQVVLSTTPSKKSWADMESDDEGDFVFNVPEQQLSEQKSKKRTHRGGRSRDKRDAQALRKAQMLESASTVFSTLPEAVLSYLATFAELNAVGSLAVCNRSTRACLWENATFWNNLGGPTAFAACSVAPLKHIASRDAFRVWLFGFHGEWAVAFNTFATTASVTEVLSEASYLVGGLMIREKDCVDELVHAVAVAASRAQEDFEDAEMHLQNILVRANKRTEIFSESALIELAEAKESLQERSLLARLEVEDDVANFNPFDDNTTVEEDEEEADWTVRPRALEAADADWVSEDKEQEERGLDLDFAQSFLDLLA